MKFYPYKKACALLVTGALTAGAAVPALAAEAKTEAPQNAEESKTKAMTLKEIQELVVKNNRLKTTLTLNQEKVIAGLSAIDDGLKDLKDSQDKAAHARRDCFCVSRLTPFSTCTVLVTRSCVTARDSFSQSSLVLFKSIFVFFSSVC